jgi:hypothetical protein
VFDQAGARHGIRLDEFEQIAVEQSHLSTFDLVNTAKIAAALYLLKTDHTQSNRESNVSVGPRHSFWRAPRLPSPVLCHHGGIVTWAALANSPFRQCRSQPASVATPLSQSFE